MKRAIILVFSGILLLGGSATFARFQIRYRTIANTRYLFLRDIATYYGMTYTLSGKRISLRSKYSHILFTIGSRESHLNGIKIHLSFAPAVSRGEALLGSTDFQLLVDPILRSAALPRKQIRRVMIDPGHGGKDRGTHGRRHTEKTLCLAIARKTAAALRKKGYQVMLTRSTDRTLALGARPVLCRKWQADVFISIHANYVGTPSVRGIETFLVTPRGTASTYGKKTTAATCPNNNFDKQDAKLAYEVQKCLIRHTGAPDRGIKHARFLVLRRVCCPSILIETGFLSNKTDETLLASPAYQQKIAAGIAEGLARYAGSLAKKP